MHTIALTHAIALSRTIALTDNNCEFALSIAPTNQNAPLQQCKQWLRSPRTIARARALTRVIAHARLQIHRPTNNHLMSTNKLK